jgi:hypothetical protein
MCELSGNFGFDGLTALFTGGAGLAKNALKTKKYIDKFSKLKDMLKQANLQFEKQIKILNDVR